MPPQVTTLVTRRRMKPAALILGMMCLASATQPSFAVDNSQVLERLQALEQLIEAQQRQIETQQRQIESERAEIEALKAQLQTNEPRLTDAEKPAEDEKQDAGASYERGRPTVTAQDGLYTLSVRGRVQFDIANYFQDEAGPLATDWRRGSVGGGRENIAATDLSSGKNFRRAQLGIEGRLGRNFGYRMMPEFGGSGAEENPRLNEAWLSYAGPCTVDFPDRCLRAAGQFG